MLRTVTIRWSTPLFVVSFRKYVFGTMQWLSVLAVGVLIWPMATLLFFRAVGWMFPAVYFLGPGAIEWTETLLSEITNVPHDLFWWFVRQGLLASGGLVVGGTLTFLTIAAALRRAVSAVRDRFSCWLNRQSP